MSNARGQYGRPSIGADAGSSRPSSSSDASREADERFWKQTHYKPGQRLSQSDPADVRMMPVWMDIYRQVIRERSATEQPPKTVVVPVPTPQPIPVLAQPATPPAPTPESEEDADMPSPWKALFVVGGLVTAGVIGKFLFTEFKFYRLARKIRQPAAPAPRRARPAAKRAAAQPALPRALPA